ncbi:hypothetical protein V5799_017666 [Amblyomma americanum]|uniref:Uncharacterized protein n=1 Tax=Amblyomma americanum TaxID=6943 RepID=A0AAQ4F236_AMBAM
MDDVASRPRLLDREKAVPPQEAPISPRSKDAEPQLLFLLSGAAATATLVAVALTVSVYLINRRRKDNDETKGAFCCPAQAAQLFAYVNTSFKPCKNLFAHVCSNAIRYGTSKHHAQDSELVHALVTGLIRKGVETRDAGQFLTAYYKSCVGTIPHRELFLTTLASALIRNAVESPGKLDTRGALRYMITASAKYNLPSAIFVAFRPYTSTISLKVIPICGISGVFSDAVAATTKVLKEYVNTTEVAQQGVASLQQDVCLSGVRGHDATYTMPSRRDAFNREVWDIGDLEVGLSSVDYSLQDLRSVEVTKVQPIRLIHDLIAAVKKVPNGFAAATMTTFLVSHSVARAAMGFYRAYGTSSQILFQNLSRVAVARPSPIFAENLLRGRAYNIDVNRERMRGVRDHSVVTYATLKFLGERHLIIPASIYGYIYTGPGNNQLPNATVLGQLLAEGLWLMVLYGIEWRPQTSANINRFAECFVRNYLDGNDASSPEAVEALSIRALGMSSVARALERPGWYTVRVAWSVWRLSHAQFF